MAMFEDLLAKGYLPVQLPPGFTSESFAMELNKFQGVWGSTKVPKTLAERYSVARSSYFRRSTMIVNPISYYFLAKEISTYWPQIQTHYQKSQMSKSIPTLGGTLRAIELPKFGELYEEKITSSSGYKYALVTDITSYFPTIYTHTIPWALHGKAIAKVNQKHIPLYFGNILDSKCMHVQDGQTIGLPIGPDTSHIIAEIIGVAIDELLQQELKGWPKGFRYVDDFYLFFNRREEAEQALAAITKAIGQYELQINASKTRVIEVKELVEESWKYSVKKLSISPKRKQQRDDIHHYFESLFSLEHRFKDESLVKYGLKQLSSTIIKKSNWDVLEAYLLKCGYSFPNTIQIIAHILSTYRFHGYPLNVDAITRFCNTLVQESSRADHHGEVSWLLWICKELGINLEASAVNEVIRMGSPVCTLILLDLCNSGVVTKKIAIKNLLPIADEAALIGPEWLLAYEAGRRKWLGNKNIKHISNNVFFNALRKAGVRFYDESKKIAPIFDFKTPIVDLQQFDWDNDDAVESIFEFDDNDEEYFDSATPHDDLPATEDFDIF